jgi:hypothetical protein
MMNETQGRTDERVTRFPKVLSPFTRSEDEHGCYTVNDEVNDGFEWVFATDDVLAVEKLHGTNCAVRITESETGLQIEPWTRHGSEGMNRVEPFGPTVQHRLTRAFQNSLRRGYLDELGEGVHYGEVVGPDFHGNAYELSENLFIPFQWLVEKCSYRSWGKYPKTLDSLREWFSTELFSLFYSRLNGTDLETASVANGTFCEGIVFVHPDASYRESEMTMTEQSLGGGRYRKVASNLAKLRRDMFAGYQHDEWPMTHYGDH